MKRTTSLKKLTLDRTTIRTLTATELEGAQGGVIFLTIILSYKYCTKVTDGLDGVTNGCDWNTLSA